MKKTLLVAILAHTVCCSLQAAQENRLEEIVVSSSRVAMPLRQIGTSVTVLTQDDIELRGLNSLSDILRTTTAIGVSRNGGPGQATALRIRGEEGFRTLVLFDGIEISDATLPQVGPQIQHIQSSGIGRVEILRGAQGMMYGADAGGVINVSTRQTDQPLASGLSIEGGRYHTEQLAAYIGGRGNRLDYYLSATDFASDGFNTRTSDTLLQDQDGYENTSVHARVGWQASDQMRLELVARNTNATNEYDGCFSTLPSNDCQDDFDQSNLRISLQHRGEIFDHQFSYQDNDIERSSFSDDLESFSTEGGISSFNYLGKAEFIDDTALVYGLEFEDEAITSNAQRTERRQNGAFLEFQDTVTDRFFYTAGLRHDDNEDFGKYTSHRVSAAYLFELASGNTLKLKSSLGTGFRAPSPFELSFNAATMLPPLKEETSAGFDLGLEYFGANQLHLELVYFDQQVEDEIFFFFDPSNPLGSGYLQATGKNTSTGIELLADIPLGTRWLLALNYTYNDTETAAGAQRSRRPKQLANLRLTYQGSHWIFSTNTRTSQDAIDSTTMQALADYTVTDGSATYIVNDTWRIVARIENAFDEDYQEVPGFNTAGAAAYIGVKIDL